MKFSSFFNEFHSTEHSLVFVFQQFWQATFISRKFRINKCFIAKLVAHFALALYAYKLRRIVGQQLIAIGDTSRTINTNSTNNIVVFVVSILCRQQNICVRTMATDSSVPIQLSEVDVLNQPHCKIRDRQRVEQIINEIVQGGSNELQVVTDFDFTLTKQITASGKPTLSSFGMFNRCKSVPTSLRDESKKLYDKYRPIEIDPKLSQTEKKAKMIDWWTESRELIK